MFTDRLTLFVFVAAFGLLLLVLELVRRRALAEKYSLLWLIMAGAILVLTVARPALDRIAPLLGIYYAPSALFVAGFVGLLVILLYFGYHAACSPESHSGSAAWDFAGAYRSS